MPGTAPLDNGQTIPPPLVPGGGAGVLIASGVFNSVGGTATAQLREGVYREASGTLDFYFQLTNTDGISSITQLENFFGFSAYAISVGYTFSPPSGAGFAAGTALLSTVARAVDGSNLFFNFAPGFGPGVTSVVFMVSTNATSFNTSGQFLVSGNPGTYGGYNGPFVPTGPGVPVASAPESGASVLLLLLGLAGLSIARRSFNRGEGRVRGQLPNFGTFKPCSRLIIAHVDS